MSDELIKCPKCKSTQIHASKKGFSVGKAVIGTLTGGILLGAVTGSIGKDKLFLTCLKCNNQFKIGEKEKKQELPAELPTDSFGIGLLIIVSLILVAIFSSLMIWLLG